MSDSPVLRDATQLTSQEDAAPEQTDHQNGSLNQQGQKQLTEARVVKLEKLLERQAEHLQVLTEQVNVLMARQHELLQILARRPKVQVPSSAGTDTELPPPQQSTPSAKALTGRAALAVQHAEYQRLLVRLRETVAGVVPSGATVIVVSKGDEELIKLSGRAAWHFPQNDKGEYAGYYPKDSATAIAHLEYLRARGGEYLLIPSTGFWWLEHYSEFGQHLESNYRIAARQDDTCIIFVLRDKEATQQHARPVEQLIYQQLVRQLRQVVDSILPTDAVVVVLSKGDEQLLSLGANRVGWHYPQCADGQYLGRYPTDSNSAIAQLEALRSRGGEYLLIPSIAFEWLEHDQEFKRYLESNYRLVARQGHICYLFALLDSHSS